MNTQTEQKLIDHLYKCVFESSHRDELLTLMYEQIQEDTLFCINDTCFGNMYPVDTTGTT